MRAVATLFSFVVLLCLPQAVLAESAGDALRAADQRGLRNVSDNRIDALLYGPTAGTSDLLLTRAWVDSQPRAKGDNDWRCLAEALYFEARGETVQGQFAVAEVILNRVDSARFPKSVCGVIRQGTGKRYQCQFTYTCDGHAEVIREALAFERVSKIARAALDGVAPKLTDGATHYHTRAVRPRWSRIYTKTAAIGDHLFYRHTFQTAKN